MVVDDKFRTVTTDLCFFSGIRRWNEYVEHADDIDVDGNFKRTSRNLEEDQDMLQLGEETLTRNLGLDVVVVVTKVNYLFLIYSMKNLLDLQENLISFK